jgi:hypothetical protein
MKENADYDNDDSIDDDGGGDGYDGGQNYFVGE